MPTRTTPTNANIAQESQLHTIRNATTLIARLAANAVVAPGIQESTRTIRSLVSDLKPAVLQAPKANDAAIQQALARAEKIREAVIYIGETTDGSSAMDINSPVTQFKWQLQKVYDFLGTWEERLETLLRQSFLAKFANQDKIGQQLVEYNQELTDHLSQLQTNS
ncbi:hypothetical protein FRC07_002464 [Ceratobasidium sp. 392]|nr:hypothetical protein FRC07_002464 [Ceratobasidium sp. 392]